MFPLKAVFLLMPDNTFITAFIGGGKSRCAVGFVCTELEQTERLISTSLPIFVDDHWHRIPRGKGRIHIPPQLPSWWLPEVQLREVPDKPDSLEVWMFGLETWCHNEVKKPVDLNKRLRLLKHEEISKFYLHLPNKDLPEVTTALPGRKPFTLPDLTERHDDGCLFVLDEVHIYFSAHGWAEAGPGVEMYQSQLRHLNDDMVMVSQHLEKVNKNFRRNATRTYEISNLGNQRLWAGVTIKERFQWKLYSGTPLRGDKPIDTGKFMLRDRGMCWLYDTMAGAGVSGGMKADAPPKGRHWSTWFLILGLILVAAWYLPKFAMHSFGYGVGHMVQSMEKGVTKGVMGGKKPQNFASGGPRGPEKVVSGPEKVVSDTSRPDLVGQPGETAGVLTTSGWIIFDGHATVYLSDGSQLDSSQDKFTVYPGKVVTASGTVYLLWKIPSVFNGMQFGVQPVRSSFPPIPGNEDSIEDSGPQVERSAPLVIGQGYHNSHYPIHRGTMNYAPSFSAGPSTVTLYSGNQLPSSPYGNN
jgi:hypothetical protein